MGRLILKWEKRLQVGKLCGKLKSISEKYLNIYTLLWTPGECMLYIPTYWNIPTY